MNLSRVIKPSSAGSRENEILTASSGGGGADNFQSLDSLWRDDEGNIASVGGMLERKKLLQKEAEKIVSEAQSRAALIEKKAFDKGFEEGKAAGRRDVSDRLQEIAMLFGEIEKERKALYKNYEENVIGLTKMMVDKIVSHEVSVNPGVISACVKKALSYVIENTQVKVHLSSIDFSRIKEASFENPDILEGYGQIELIEDQAISPGGCLLETEFGEVDATTESRKAKLFEAIDEIFLQSMSDG